MISRLFCLKTKVTGDFEYKMVNKMKNSRILVTGGAGFIGSNLVKTLLESGNEVVALDNFITGKRENISAFSNCKNFYFIEGDIRDADLCRKAVDGIDYVLHQAALGAIPRAIKDPATTTQINICGFVNMLHAAKDAGVKRFIYASSSSVYGDNKTLPKQEHLIGKPLNPYAITKYTNELFAENFYSLYGIETIGLRYFNVFGPNQDSNGAYAAVIPKFADALINHNSPRINGDGSYSRDFTYIDNVVKANILAMTVKDPQAVNQVYNIAAGKRTTILELFKILRDELTKYDSEIIKIEPLFGNIRTGDIPHSSASIEKAENMLGYSPEIDVETGIRKTIPFWLGQKKEMVQ